MAKSTPFLPCEACLWIQEREPKHVVREARHVLTIDADAEHDMCCAALCHEHRDDWRRVHAQGEPEYATH